MAWERLDKFAADLCASEACNQMGVAAEWRFERGGIGSQYCESCRLQLIAMTRMSRFPAPDTIIHVQSDPPPDPDNWVYRRFTEQT